MSGGGGKPSFPSPSAGDLRELPRVPLRGEVLNEVYPEHPVLKLNLTHPKLLVPITLIYPLLSVTYIIFQCAI